MGTETISSVLSATVIIVEKMGPLRGDGNAIVVFISITPFFVEKMGPLRGDGNFFFLLISQL